MVILTASSGGLFPMPIAPAYATAKAGLVHFTRSLAPRLHKRGIRLCALCPQQVDTALVSSVFNCPVEDLECSAPCPQQINTAWMSRLGLCLLHQSGYLLIGLMPCPLVKRRRARTAAALCCACSTAALTQIWYTVLAYMLDSVLAITCKLADKLVYLQIQRLGCPCMCSCLPCLAASLHTYGSLCRVWPNAQCCCRLAGPR